MTHWVQIRWLSPSLRQTMWSERSRPPGSPVRPHLITALHFSRLDVVIESSDFWRCCFLISSEQRSLTGCYYEQWSVVWGARRRKWTLHFTFPASVSSPHVWSIGATDRWCTQGKLLNHKRATFCATKRTYTILLLFLSAKGLSLSYSLIAFSP